MPLKVQQSIVENAEIVELPEEMIHEEVHRSVNEFLETCNVKVSTLTCTSKSQELLKKTFTNNTKQRLSRTKTNLVIEAVAKAEGFDASEEEIQKEIEQLAADYNMEVAQVQNLLSADMLKHDIAIKKKLLN